MTLLTALVHSFGRNNLTRNPLAVKKGAHLMNLTPTARHIHFVPGAPLKEDCAATTVGSPRLQEEAAQKNDGEISTDDGLRTHSREFVIGQDQCNGIYLVAISAKGSQIDIKCVSSKYHKYLTYPCWWFGSWRRAATTSRLPGCFNAWARRCSTITFLLGQKTPFFLTD